MSRHAGFVLCFTLMARTHLHLPPLTPIDMLHLMLLGVYRYTFLCFMLMA